ncbi:hypothetical protein RBB50_003767, partial [Rhinocladiella similis]
ACRSFNTVRLMAFLADPTPGTWDKFTADPSHTAPVGTRAIDNPFMHRCHRGPTYGAEDNGQARCINGREHGRFGTKDENEEMKACSKTSAACICPGHGAEKSKCIFTHDDGTPAPCLNVDDYVP